MASVHLGFISLESGQFPFYPQWLHDLRGQRGGELLPFYARQLGTIEMTSVNYRIPSPADTRQWADSVPEGFVFHVKIFGLFSFGSCPRDALPRSAQLRLRHGGKNVSLRRLPADVIEEVWSCFRAALEPLREQGKLGVVVCQFPATFRPCQDNFERLRQISERIAPSSLAAEFRSPEWGSSPQAERLLRRMGVACVHTDDNGSYNENNNFRELPRRLVGETLGYCRIHRRPLNRSTGLVCENVTREDIEVSMEPDPLTGLAKGDLLPAEVTEWQQLLSDACAAMAPGGRVYVMVSTIGRNASADNVERLRVALGDLVPPWRLGGAVSEHCEVARAEPSVGGAPLAAPYMAASGGDPEARTTAWARPQPKPTRWTRRRSEGECDVTAGDAGGSGVEALQEASPGAAGNGAATGAGSDSHDGEDWVVVEFGGASAAPHCTGNEPAGLSVTGYGRWNRHRMAPSH